MFLKPFVALVLRWITKPVMSALESLHDSVIAVDEVPCAATLNGGETAAASETVSMILNANQSPVMIVFSVRSRIRRILRGRVIVFCDVGGRSGVRGADVVASMRGAGCEKRAIALPVVCH